jgi:hypothetical protein
VAAWRRAAAARTVGAVNVVGISRPVLVTLIVTGALLLLGGAAWVLSFVTLHRETSTRVLAAGSTLDVRGKAGDIRVVGSDRDDVRLTIKQRRTLFGRPHVKVGSADGQLVLDGHCSEFELVGLDAHCAITYLLEVPRRLAVHVAAGLGDVRAEHLAGDADLETTTGDVRALDVLGRLRLHATAGDVHADAPSTNIVASATSGDVDVEARNGEQVRAQAVSGDVHVHLPDRTYDVRTRATSGEAHIQVRVDRSSPRHIAAATTSGDVHVELEG